MRALQLAPTVPPIEKGALVPARLRRIALVGGQLALIALAYYVGVRLGLGFRFKDTQISLVWPPNAIILAALLLTPRSRWWTVLLAGAVAHIAAMAPHYPAWRWLWQIAGNSALTVTTAIVVSRFAGSPLRFDSRRQVLVYMGTAFVASGGMALIMPAFVRSAFGIEQIFSPRISLLGVMLSNASGLLLITPIIVLWAQRVVRPVAYVPVKRLLEVAAILASLLVVGAVAFGTGSEIAPFPSVLLLIFPPLLWAAVRGGPLGAATSLCFVAALSALGTARHMGPFIVASTADQVLSLQLFWIVIWLPVMLLAAAIREREETEDALHDLRSQLAHAMRVATAGELSGAFAHELRQPLTAILANAQAGIRLLTRNPTEVQQVREILEDIVQRDRHAADVIARVRSFLLEGDSRFDTVEVDAVVRDAISLSRSTVELLQVDVQAQICAGLPPVRGDPVQLLQVVLNLIVNACEAMISVPQRDRQLRLAVGRCDEHVEVTVADRGVGLPAGHEDRVFEPFFTTKPKRLGLGLAIGRSIAAAHGGRLWAENNPQQGATFHLALDAHNGNGKHAPAAQNGNGKHSTAAHNGNGKYAAAGRDR